MKILLYTDNHFCEKASIIQGYGQKYSKRLENQIKSINWAEKLADESKCSMIICLGDFFDKPDLNQYEITAAKDIKWSTLPHYFLVGNHESGVSCLDCSSTKFLEGPNKAVVSTPTQILVENTELAFLPYVVESERKPLFEVFKTTSAKHRILLSHNDIKGIRLGPVESKVGYEVNELESIADICINGHLHNGQKISNKVINLGNLTGKDFGEDARKYAHNIMIIDTNTLKYELVENPFAYNFYKLEINQEKDLSILTSLKRQAVLSIKCKDILVDRLKSALLNYKEEISESRIIITRDNTSLETNLNTPSLQTGDHLQKLIDYCKERLDNTDILNYELGELCR